MTSFQICTELLHGTPCPFSPVLWHRESGQLCCAHFAALSNPHSQASAHFVNRGNFECNLKTETKKPPNNKKLMDHIKPTFQNLSFLGVLSKSKGIIKAFFSGETFSSYLYVIFCKHEHQKTPKPKPFLR